jgi:hypothetical protein
MGVHLGFGERLIFVGHDVAIVVADEGEEFVYFADDWNAECAASAEIDGDGDVAFLNSDGGHYRWVAPREPRCASERARAERIFARDFQDRTRVST